MSSELTTFVVQWHARLVFTSPRAGLHFMRTVDELAAIPLVSCPRYEWAPAGGHVTFEYRLPASVASDPTDTARQVLTHALHQAHVGTPYPPIGLTDVAVALVLADGPTITYRGAR